MTLWCGFQLAGAAFNHHRAVVLCGCARGVLGTWYGGVVGAGRKRFIPADSQHLFHRLAAASMVVVIFVCDWLKFRQGRQNLILCREGPCNHSELFLFEMSSILDHIIARRVFSTGTTIRR